MGIESSPKYKFKYMIFNNLRSGNPKTSLLNGNYGIPEITDLCFLMQNH